MLERERERERDFIIKKYNKIMAIFVWEQIY